MNITGIRARRKLREWLRRYLPAETIGTLTALGGFWAAYELGAPLVLAAIAGTVGENVGYYGTISFQEARRHWSAHRSHASLKRLWLTGLHTVRNLVVDFGFAEMLDSFVVRPGLFYLLPLIFSGQMAWALLAAKIIADLVFYASAITSYELRKKYWPNPEEQSN